jgi:hypothetical protein
MWNLKSHTDRSREKKGGCQWQYGGRKWGDIGQRVQIIYYKMNNICYYIINSNLINAQHADYS